jgi:hypothetical protein
MKRTQINSLRGQSHDVLLKTEVKNYDGNIVEFVNTPQFSGPRVCVPGANSKKFWSEHSKDGYKEQMRMGAKLLYKEYIANPKKFNDLNLTPEEIANLQAGKDVISDRLVLHHTHSNSLNGTTTDCEIQLVRKEQHDIKHRGGSYSSNNDRVKNKIKEKGNWEESKLKRAINTLEFEAYKHPIATSAGAGGILGGLFCGAYKAGGKLFGYKPTNAGYVVAFSIGATIGGLATYNKLNDGKIYK